jgi:hypothetical protein
MMPQYNVNDAFVVEGTYATGAENPAFNASFGKLRLRHVAMQEI